LDWFSRSYPSWGHISDTPQGTQLEINQ